MSVRGYPCKFCGIVFNNRSNKYRHERKYCPQSEDAPATPPSPTIPKKKIEVKVKVKVKVKANTEPEDIMNELHSLRERVKKMESEPRKTYNNWIIIGPDMYNDMVDKYGRSDAIGFLTQSAITGDSINVIKKLYLDGISPEKYPIACKNYRHFRYLNDKREVIDDRGGKSVQKIFSDRAHRAMVLATNEMQEELMDQSQDEVEAAELFRKLGEVQCSLASVHAVDIDRLAGMTNNPNHPFFLDPEET